MIAHCECKWQRILNHHRITANVRFPTDTAKLMYTGVSSDVRVVFNNYVTGERSGIRHDHAITEYAIVGNVGLCHEQAVVANPGQHFSAGGTAMDCHKLPDQVSPADACFGGLTFVFQILGGKANGNKRKDSRVLPNHRTAIYYNVRVQTDTVFQLYVIADNRKGTNETTTSYTGAWADNGTGMDVIRLSGNRHKLIGEKGNG